MAPSPQLAAALRQFSRMRAADRGVILGQLDDDLKDRLLSLLDQVERQDPSSLLTSAVRSSQASETPKGMTQRAAQALAEIGLTLDPGTTTISKQGKSKLADWMARVGLRL